MTLKEMGSYTSLDSWWCKGSSVCLGESCRKALVVDEEMNLLRLGASGTKDWVLLAGSHNCQSFWHTYLNTCGPL